MAMTTVTENTQLTFTDEGFQSFLNSRNEPGWLTEIRNAAWERFKELPWPSSKDEEWMRTDIRLFHLEKFNIPSARGSSVAPNPVLADGVELAGSAESCNGERLARRIWIPPYQKKESSSDRLAISWNSMAI